MQHFKKWKFLTFSYLVGHLCPPGSGSGLRIRIRIQGTPLNPDPDPQQWFKEWGTLPGQPWYKWSLIHSACWQVAVPALPRSAFCFCNNFKIKSFFTLFCGKMFAAWSPIPVDHGNKILLRYLYRYQLTSGTGKKNDFFHGKPVMH